MAKLIKRKKPMTVDPVKVSQTMGASLAFLGLDKSIPLLHGNQGCSAYGKILFIRHFYEPVPLQTTGLDHLAAVMDPDQNLKEGLVTVCEKNKPEIIGVLTTGVSEAEGTDIKRIIKEFRMDYPQYDDVLVIPVCTPDYLGCLESGYAAAVEAIIDNCIVQSPVEVKEKAKDKKKDSKDLVILPSAMHTPADIETIRLMVEMFGLNPILLPDLSGSLDGHLAESRYSPITYGGSSKGMFERIASACGVVSIGLSMKSAGMLLHQCAGISFFHFDGLTGIKANDEFMAMLMKLSGNPVPAMYKRQRQCLRDAYLDAHFYLGQCRLAVAADPDLLIPLQALSEETGLNLQYAVTSDTNNSEIKEKLEGLGYKTIQEGDLEDFRKLSYEYAVDLVVGNSYLAEFCEDQELAHYRAGYPIYDRMGGSRICRVGYAGTTDMVLDMANLVWQQRPEGADPYTSVFKRNGGAYDTDAASHASH
ncbi:MAG: nitrogenase iron-molybdenum cofactor biosynthesis protein NifN [Gammaproteobacteria bacterium]|nr:MAG: nitrogenase iron-molybdenum cofactor biosynthesis protein NifN [Gammaproteobacteria bacterium]